MNIMRPEAFGLTIFLFVLIGYYFYRKQFIEKITTTTLFHEQLMREWEATKWYKKLQQWLLLFLQLLLLTALIFALAKPYVVQPQFATDRIFIVIDQSASMSATSSDMSRLQWAKQQAETLLAKQVDEAVTVIAAGVEPTVLIKDETDRTKVVRAIQAIEQQVGAGSIDEAVQLAKMLGRNESEIFVYGDQMTIPTDKAVSIQFSAPSETVTNVAISSAQAVDRMLYVTVRNDGEQRVKVPVVVADRRQVVTVAPRAETLVQFAAPNVDVARVSLALEDDYALDNETFVMMNGSTNSLVYVLGTVNPFVLQLLPYIAENVQMIDSEAAMKDRSALVITSERVNVPNPTLFIPRQAEKTKPMVKATVKQQATSLLRYVRFDDVFIDRYVEKPFRAGETLVSANGIPLVIASERRAPFVALQFPLEASDWMMKPSFPLFFNNVVKQLRAQSVIGTFAPLTPVQQPLKEGERWQYDGTEVTLTDRLPNQLGLYEREGKQFITVLPNEEKWSATMRPFVVKSDVKQTETRAITPLLWPFIVAAFIIYLVEGEVYRRGFAIRRA